MIHNKKKSIFDLMKCLIHGFYFSSVHVWTIVQFKQLAQMMKEHRVSGKCFGFLLVIQNSDTVIVWSTDYTEQNLHRLVGRVNIAIVAQPSDSVPFLCPGHLGEVLEWYGSALFGVRFADLLLSTLLRVRK
jgi:hypothetical protein